MCIRDRIYIDLIFISFQIRVNKFGTHFYQERGNKNSILGMINEKLEGGGDSVGLKKYILTLIHPGGGIFAPPVEQTQIAPEGRNLRFSNFVTFNFSLLRTFLPIFMLPLSIFFDLWFFF